MPPHRSHPSRFSYDQDYHLWLQAMVKLLHDRRFSELDIENLVEELEDMGKRERRAVESNLEIVLIHLLKYQYQPELRSNSWRYTLFEHRDRLQKLFRDSPSLRSYCRDIFEACYDTARKKAAIETDLPLETFPSIVPFTLEFTLNSDNLPH